MEATWNVSSKQSLQKVALSLATPYALNGQDLENKLAGRAEQRPAWLRHGCDHRREDEHLPQASLPGELGESTDVNQSSLPFSFVASSSSLLKDFVGTLTAAFGYAFSSPA